MNAEALLAHYQRIADESDAIERLRRLILDLAVRGKLVASMAGDESAWEAVQRLTAENTKRMLKNPKSKTASDKKEATRPFAVPPQWAFVRLGEVLQMINGRAFKPTEWMAEGLPIVRIQNLNNPNALYNFCDPGSVERRHVIENGEFLISWSGTPGTSFGAFIWERGTAALNQHIFRCILIGDAYSKEFLRLAINSQLDVLIGQAQGGVGLQHVTKGTLESLPLPLPPIAEQHRIVAKVDALMELCDQLEAARAQREAARDRLAVASLGRLNALDPDTFPADVRFALDILPALTTRLDQIKQLRQTILNLAVHGKLVPQNPKDEHASRLVERIVMANGCRPRMASPEGWEAHPQGLPTSWISVPLGQLITTGPQNGISPKPTKREDAPKAITLTATTRGIFDPSHFKHVEASFSTDSDYWLENGDLLFQRGNTREYVGIAAVYEGPSKTFVFPDLIIKVRVTDLVSLRFIHLVCVAPHARKYFSENASGAQSTMPKINQGILVSLPVALPPLVEQHRIVAKVDELMTLCDQLEASLSAGQTTRRRLLDALLHEALMPTAAPSKHRLRIAVSGYVVSRLSDKRNFGRTAHMKYLYLAEARVGLDLGGRYMREAAGPLDTGIYELEKQAEAADWYTHRSETLASGNEKVSYKPGKALKAIANEGITVLGSSRTEMDRLLDLMGDLKTEQVEIIATLFAAWNDALFDGHSPDDDWIVKEVREHWHIRKQRFEPLELLKWLGWMRKNDIVPLGHPPRTVQQTTMGF